MLQAYVTSGQVLGKHSQAGHTHIDPDVGLGGARGRLLPEEEEVSGEKFQLRPACLGLLDNLGEEELDSSFIDFMNFYNVFHV